MTKQPLPLQPVSPDEFLPPISRWSRLGGLVLVGGLGGAIALSAWLEYDVTVKAPAVVRPEGELRIVEATASGRVQQILVEVDDAVEAGEELVLLDEAELRSRQRQIEAELTQLQRQQVQIQQELLALDTQIAAERRAGEGAIASASAELELRQQAYRDDRITAATNLREAEAAVQFAREEFNRYQQLADTGALPDLQLQEKKAALETALARLERARGLLEPNDAGISQARENVRQVQGREEATIARLGQTQEALRRQQVELDRQQQTQQQILQQVQRDLDGLILRSPISGTIQSLTLRNPNQVLEVGEAIAAIAPDSAHLVVRANVSQTDINRVEIGQLAKLRLDSCPYTDYGLLEGQIAAIAPDTQTLEPGKDETAAFYRVEIAPAAGFWLPQPQTCTLQPGMRGQAEIVTQRETVLKSLARKLRLSTGL